MKKTLLTTFLFYFLFTACGKKQETNEGVTSLSEDETIAYSAEAAFNATKDFSDDTGSYSGANEKISSKTSCQLAAQQACSEGIKSIEYNSCVLNYNNATVSGFVSLDYSEQNCNLENTNSFVNRTYDLVFDGSRGQIQVSSNEKSDYKGNSYGGGRLLTHLGDDLWEIEILGQHRSYKNSRGRELVNVSISTIDPIVISGDYQSQNRTLVSGEIQVTHNLAKSTATHTFNNIQYSDQCCYPISGQLSIDITGRLNRSGIIEFDGCGTAKFYKSDSTEAKNLTFSSCN